jgi:hypothetical protein
MQKESARRVIQVAFSCSSELQGLLGELKATCGTKEYIIYARSIAAVIDSINVELVTRTIAAHPDLAAEIEQNLKVTGRAMGGDRRNTLDGPTQVFTDSG